MEGYLQPVSENTLENDLMNNRFASNNNYRFSKRKTREINSASSNIVNRPIFSDVQGPSNFNVSDRYNRPNRRSNDDNHNNCRANYHNTNNSNGKQQNYFHRNNFPKKNQRKHNWKNSNEKVEKKSQVDLANLNQRDSLIWQLMNNKYECMICVSIIRAESPTWSCDNCFHIFHIICIKKWAIKSSDNSESRPTDGYHCMARCPACQKLHEFSTVSEASVLSLSLVYYCWCGKEKNPVFRRGGASVPHSCENVCGKSLSLSETTACMKRDNSEWLALGDAGEVGKLRKEKKERVCSHQCGLLCHPGPCPSCDALVVRNCPCGVTRVTAKCSADERTLVCGQCCGALLNCGIHRCKESCHAEECSPCEIVLRQYCFCDKRRERRVICGGDDTSVILVTQNESEETEETTVIDEIQETKISDIIDKTKEIKISRIIDENGSFTCGGTCGRLLDCGNHRCEQLCHIGECCRCEFNPSILDRCWCGKKSQAELGHERLSCLDAVESCGSRCGKKMVVCGHECDRKCHPGPCEPCPLFEDRLCRCGKSLITNVACASLTCDRNISENIDQIGETDLNNGPYSNVLCKSVCRKKLMCGRHKCGERCCSLDLHWCPQTCGRPLSCGKHRCERDCGHTGHCPTCQNVSFEEATCECGRRRELPPIACGQAPPSCSETCSRQHSCDHPVRHNCHSEPNCPPCTQLMSKPCPGGHTILDNVPCFRAVVTCGLPCNRPLKDCDHTCQRICHFGDCYDTTSADLSSVAQCRQPCVKKRSDCSHLCGAPCHQNIDCQSVWGHCSVPVDIVCQCGLKSVRLECGKIDHNSTIECDLNCASAVNLGERIDSICRLPKALSILWKHYTGYFELFCRNNFAFVVNVEKIFADLLINKSSITNQNSHKFLSMPIDKAKFICRLSLIYKVSARVVYDFPSNSAHVTAHATDSSSIPKFILSKIVEEKHFKIYKPIF